jgi:hypothetical protein
MLARSLALLVAALAAGCAAAPEALAGPGTMDVTPEIFGAGKIRPAGAVFGGCTQAPPATSATRMVCPNFTMEGPSGILLTAEPVPGWSFDRWIGCDITSGNLCGVSPLGDGTRLWHPEAHFVDRTQPTLSGLTATPVAGNEGYYAFTWTASEPGVTGRCALDGSAYTACDSGMRVRLDEGVHAINVYGVDPSGNKSSSQATTTVTVVDTSLPVAPPDGAHRRSTKFAAASGVGDTFECSIDGGNWITCGLGPAGGNVPLSLPTIAEGRHELLVRARKGAAVDLFPVSRTFTLDWTAPETTIRATADGFALASDEAGATFRCRIDDRPYGPCEATTKLAPGPHEVEAFATDEAGNADATPAMLEWTLAAPPEPPVETPGDTVAPAGPAPDGVGTPAGAAPSGTGASGAPASGAAPAAAARPAAPTEAKRVAFTLRYRYAKGRLTSLKAVGLPKGTKTTVKVTCRKRSRCPKSPTTIARLVGKRLSPGTRIAVTAGAATRTITLPRSR